MLENFEIWRKLNILLLVVLCFPKITYLLSNLQEQCQSKINSNTWMNCKNIQITRKVIMFANLNQLTV